MKKNLKNKLLKNKEDMLMVHRREVKKIGEIDCGGVKGKKVRLTLIGIAESDSKAWDDMFGLMKLAIKNGVRPIYD